MKRTQGMINRPGPESLPPSHANGQPVKRKLRSRARTEFYSLWHEERYRSGDLNAIVEFAWKFPRTAKSARWFRAAISCLVSIVIRDRKGKGRSLRRIAALLNRMRIPARRGNRWFASSVRAHECRMLHKLVNPTDAGRILCAIYRRRRQDLSCSEAVARGDARRVVGG